MSMDRTEGLSQHSRPVGKGVITVLIVLIGFGIVTTVGIFVVGISSASNVRSSNQAGAANQNYQACTLAETIRWRRATTSLQVGAVDYTNALRNHAAPAVAAALLRTSNARAELAAVNADDRRLLDGAKNPLCPYVAGQPESTPRSPVHPTPPIKPGG